MKKIIFLAVIFCFLMSTLSYAAKIHLKGGNVVEGQILSKTSYYVVVQVGPIPQKYYMAQIDRIEEDQVSAPVDLSGVENVSLKKAQLIMTLLEANGVRANLEKNIEKIIKKMPGREKELRGLFNAKDIMKSYIPVYDKYYSEEDLQKMIDFFQSPTGKHMLEVLPFILDDTVKISVDYFQKKIPPPPKK
ncbi:MAG: DUF2059 domain-containing protein [Candidatus Omnitrophica bacterium]|nr:DUF2059 domain-containing protein [Candidatus Omnitrophota bacterium]